MSAVAWAFTGGSRGGISDGDHGHHGHMQNIEPLHVRENTYVRTYVEYDSPVS